MSWGGGEFTGESSDDGYFTTPAGHPGVTFFASSGDDGAGVIWPSVSSHVVATGGTTLNVDSAGDYLSESAWSGSGGGISSGVTRPSYQNGLQIYSGDPAANGMRAVPDVAYDSDPNTGVAVYGTFGWGGWAQIGGTSAAAPQCGPPSWPSPIRDARFLVNQPSMDGYTQTLPALYQLPANAFNDITTGSNGYPAGPGFDEVTGRGSPIANVMVADLGASTAPQVLTSVSLTPGSITLGDGTQQLFTATALDQFGRPMVPQPAFTWSLSGAGALSANGLYSSPSTGSGSALVTATVSGATLSDTATVAYEPGPAITSLVANPSPVTGTTTTLTAAISDLSPGALSYTWSIVSAPSGGLTPTLSSPSGSTSPGSLSSTATFFQAGTYQFQLVVSDAVHVSASALVTVTVDQTATTIQVAPTLTLLGNSSHQQFTATVEDQFGNALSSQPAFSWSIVSGLGAISTSGLYTSPSSGAGKRDH